MTQFADDLWLYEQTTIDGLQRPNVELAAVEMYECSVTGANLSEATLRRWVFENCEFLDCDLSNATLTDCTFQGCRFERCKLVGIDWNHVSSVAFDVEFNECRLHLASFASMSLKGLIVSHSDCTDVDFTGAQLQGAQFNDTQLVGAIFRDANLEDTDFSSAFDVSLDPQVSYLRNTLVSPKTAIALAETLGITVKKIV